MAVSALALAVAFGADGMVANVAFADTAPVRIARAPDDLPAPSRAGMPQHVKVEFETVEVTGQLDDGTTFHYWTFNRQVPGPFCASAWRYRRGQPQEPDDSAMMHNVDFHAVTGPGGGAGATIAAPGEKKGFIFKALNPGLYVYHCATPMVAQHIANGMYGLILVEPEGGLPKVDHEFYVMQGEIYTEQAFGTKGELDRELRQAARRAARVLRLQWRRRRAHQAEAAQGQGGRDGAHLLRRRRAQLHLVVPRHRRDLRQGLHAGRPAHDAAPDVQTISVPPGGAAAVEFKLEVPGRYVLVDHALSRAERGLAASSMSRGRPIPRYSTRPCGNS